MNGSEGYHVKQNKPNSERHVLFYHMQNLDFKIVRQESREFWGRVRRPLEKEFGQERVMRRDE